MSQRNDLSPAGTSHEVAVSLCQSWCHRARVRGVGIPTLRAPAKSSGCSGRGRVGSVLMHPSSGWRAGGLFGQRGSSPADLERFANAMRVPVCPRASEWDPVWVWHHHMGPTNIWLAELLANEMRLRPGMRVLDMGCGSLDRPDRQSRSHPRDRTRPTRVPATR